MEKNIGTPLKICSFLSDLLSISHPPSGSLDGCLPINLAEFRGSPCSTKIHHFGAPIGKFQPDCMHDH